MYSFTGVGDACSWINKSVKQDETLLVDECDFSQHIFAIRLLELPIECHKFNLGTLTVKVLEGVILLTCR